MFIYLHGLNSSGGSEKGRLLRRELAPVPVLTPTYPAYSPERAVDLLRSYIGDALRKQLSEKDLFLVGSSMGGFYGQYLAREFPVTHTFLINPALQPWELLLPYTGEQYNEATGEAYQLRMEDVEATRKFAVEIRDDPVATTLLLDEADEVIDYRIAATLYEGRAKIHVFEDGSHRFEHMSEAIDIIRETCCIQRL